MLLHGRTISNFESTIAAFSRTDDKAVDGGIQFKRSTAEKKSDQSHKLRKYVAEITCEGFIF